MPECPRHRDFAPGTEIFEAKLEPRYISGHRDFGPGTEIVQPRCPEGTGPKTVKFEPCLDNGLDGGPDSGFDGCLDSGLYGALDVRLEGNLDGGLDGALGS